MNDLPWEAARTVIELVALTGGFLGWIYAWQQARTKAGKEEVDKVREDHAGRLNVHSERITRLEGEVKALPNHEDLQLLHTRITKVGDEVTETGKIVSGLAARLDGLSKLVDRLETVTSRQEQFLMDRGGK